MILKMTSLTASSKWFLEALGHEGLNNLLAAYPDKSAQAVCTFAYCEGPGHEPIIFQGRTDVCLSCMQTFSSAYNAQGKIVPARGPTNFGKLLSTALLRSIAHNPRLGSNLRVWGQDVS